MQPASDKDTHRLDCNYKEARIKKNCFLPFSQQVSPEFNEPCLKLPCLTCFTVPILNQRRKKGDMLVPNEKEKPSSTAAVANSTP